MMREYEKLLLKVSEKDRERLLFAYSQFKNKEWEFLDIKKLKGAEAIYRIRVGRYRLIVSVHENGSTEIITVALRSEKTYRKF